MRFNAKAAGDHNGVILLFSLTQPRSMPLPRTGMARVTRKMRVLAETSAGVAKSELRLN
jgi:hypothetical protein